MSSKNHFGKDIQGSEADTKLPFVLQLLWY